MTLLYQDKGVWFAIFAVNYKQKWVRIGKMSKTSAKEAPRCKAFEMPEKTSSISYYRRDRAIATKFFGMVETDCHRNA